MMTGLMYNRTHFLTIIRPRLPDPSFQILFQQHPFPSPPFTDTSPPPSNLSLIILTSSTLIKPCVPLKPAPGVVGVVYPAGRFPFFN